MKILLADDHQLVREGLKGILVSLSEHVEFVEAINLWQVYELLLEHNDIDIILFDLKMPGVSGPKEISGIKNQHPEIPLIVISAQQNSDIALQSIDEGANGYISKSSGTGVMLGAINIVLAGEIYFPSMLMHSELKKSTNMEILTERQRDVYQQMKLGFSNKEIAEILHCSLGTIKSHVSAILNTLNVNTRAKAIAKSFEVGI